MGSRGFNAYSKYTILKHGLKEDNISKTCDLFGISRTSYYNWMRAYKKYGMKGLEAKEAKKPSMPNKISPYIEEKILDYVIKYPNDGPKRIYYEMRAEGLEVGESGIYNVLKRNQISRREQRRDYSKTRKNNLKKEEEKDQLEGILQAKDLYPGYIVMQRIDYIGSYEGIGRIYQYSFYDVDSCWGEAKIFNKKTDIDVWSFFEQKLIYLLETFDLNIENLLTDRNKTYLPYFLKGDDYLRILDSFGIENKFIHENNYREELKGIIDFNKFLEREFYNNTERITNINSFEMLEEELVDFVRHYNFKKKIEEGKNRGKTPAEIVLRQASKNDLDFEKLPLWILALLNSSGGEI